MKKILIIMVMFALGTTLVAQDKEFKPEIKVGATIFTGLTYNMDDADFTAKLNKTSPNASNPFGFNPTINQFETSKNSFYLDRVYININAKLTPQINARITPDINSITDGSGNTQWLFNPKYAYVEYTPVSEDNGMTLGFQLGIIANQRINNAEKYYNYRFVQKTYTDYAWTTSATRSADSTSVSRSTSAFFSSADIGFTTKLVFPQKYAELYLSFYNGNGYKDINFDKTRLKDIMVTGFIYPLSGYLKDKNDAAKKSGKTRIDGPADLIVGGFAYLGSTSAGNANITEYSYNKFGGMTSFRFNFDKCGFFRIGGEYSVRSQSVPNPVDSTVSGAGFSAYLEFNPPVEVLNEKLTLLARYDNFDPSTTKPGYFKPGLTADNGKQNLLILGLFYKPSPVLTFGVSYQSLSFENTVAVKYDGTATSSINRFYFNTLLNF